VSRILIAEDDEPLRLIIAQSLAMAGHTVIQAKTGLEAESLMRREPPDLLITDLVMPDQDGIGLLMLIREEFPDVPVLVISGGVPNTGLYLDIAQKLGARRLLEKPFTPAQLKEAVRQVLGG
jgi:DNA-binding response OmpR family regulator